MADNRTRESAAAVKDFPATMWRYVDQLGGYRYRLVCLVTA